MDYLRESISDKIVSELGCTKQLTSDKPIYTVYAGRPALLTVQHNYQRISGYELTFRGSGPACTFFIRIESEDRAQYWMTELPLTSGEIKRVYMPPLANLGTIEIYSAHGSMQLLEFNLLRTHAPKTTTKLTTALSLLVTPGNTVIPKFTQDGLVMSTALGRDGQCFVSPRTPVANDDLVTILFVTATETKLLNPSGFYDVFKGEIAYIKFGAMFSPPQLAIVTRGGISNASTASVLVAVGAYYTSNIERHLRVNPTRPT